MHNIASNVFFNKIGYSNQNARVHVFLYENKSNSDAEIRNVIGVMIFDRWKSQSSVILDIGSQILNLILVMKILSLLTDNFVFICSRIQKVQ